MKTNDLSESLISFLFTNANHSKPSRIIMCSAFTPDSRPLKVYINDQIACRKVKKDGTYRPKSLHLSQSVATRVLFLSEKSVLRYALRQKRNVATPPVASCRKHTVSGNVKCGERHKTHVPIQEWKISYRLIRANIPINTHRAAIRNETTTNRRSVLGTLTPVIPGANNGTAAT